ncbi:ABC transporter permease [Streptomyces sp. JJ36]|uniref:ABC transporter permease n=1 Tax=Streptomyces sp. JJ36 TaxID=2736645 RepID=UPI001F389278|nr:ABC transporter permease [Streptomyces sp. JJ36]MCF6522075.1 ABC transporter permease [Streptomyces sp. JJ36]
MFLTYLRRELRRRRKASFVVASGLALGIALVIVVTSVSSGMRTAQDEVLESLYGLGTDMTVEKEREPGEGPRRGPAFDFDARDSGDDTEQSRQHLMVRGLQDTLDSGELDAIAGLDGVSGAVGSLGLQQMTVSGEFRRGRIEGGATTVRPGKPGDGPAVEGGGASFDVGMVTIDGVDVDHPGYGPLATSEITEGRTFRRSEDDAKVAVVAASYAAQQKLDVGDDVSVKGEKFEIIGLAAPDSGRSATDVSVPLGSAQELAGAEGRVTTVYVRTAGAQQIDEVESAISRDLPQATVTTADDLARTVSGSLNTAAGLADGVGRWLSAAVLAAAFLVAGLLTSAAVGRRVREFGTLKALGWKSGRVTRQVMGEALANGLLGGVLGIALGLAGAYAVTALSPTLTAELGATGGVFGGPGGSAGAAGPGAGDGGGPTRVLGGEAASLDIALTAPVTAGLLALAVGLAVAGGLVAGAFGGWRASRLRPADALRRVA